MHLHKHLTFQAAVVDVSAAVAAVEFAQLGQPRLQGEQAAELGGHGTRLHAEREPTEARVSVLNHVCRWQSGGKAMRGVLDVCGCITDAWHKVWGTGRACTSRVHTCSSG